MNEDGPAPDSSWDALASPGASWRWKCWVSLQKIKHSMHKTPKVLNFLRKSWYLCNLIDFFYLMPSCKNHKAQKSIGKRWHFFILLDLWSHEARCCSQNQWFFAICVHFSVGLYFSTFKSNSKALLLLILLQYEAIRFQAMFKKIV